MSDIMGESMDDGFGTPDDGIIDVEYTVVPDFQEEPGDPEPEHSISDSCISDPCSDMVCLVSLEDIIDSKLREVLVKAGHERFEKLQQRELDNLEKKIEWRVKAGKPSHDRDEVEQYCRERWPLHFEEHDIDVARFKKEFKRRVSFETRAAEYFKGGSELDMLERLVYGADAKTGFLGAIMNRTTTRYGLLYDYFMSPNKLRISDSEDYSRLVALRDLIVTRIEGPYWKRVLYEKEGGEMLRVHAMFVVNELSRKLRAYEAIGDRAVVAEDPLQLRADDPRIVLEREYESNKNRILGELGMRIAQETQQALHSREQAEPYMQYVAAVIGTAQEKITRATNGSALPDWKVNKLVRESLTECSDTHPSISERIFERDVLFLGLFKDTVAKIQDLWSDYSSRLQTLAPSYSPS